MGVDFDVIQKAYEFAIADDGEVMGLTSGDQGYEATGIFINPDTSAAEADLVEELRFYADEDNFDLGYPNCGTSIEIDGGDKARAALAAYEEKNDEST